MEPVLDADDLPFLPRLWVYGSSSSHITACPQKEKNGLVGGRKITFASAPYSPQTYMVESRLIISPKSIYSLLIKLSFWLRSRAKYYSLNLAKKLRLALSFPAIRADW